MRGHTCYVMRNDVSGFLNGAVLCEKAEPVQINDVRLEKGLCVASFKFWFRKLQFLVRRLILLWHAIQQLYVGCVASNITHFSAGKSNINTPICAPKRRASYHNENVARISCLILTGN